MYHHIITFRSLRNFGQFEHAVGSFWSGLVTFHDGQLDPESGHYRAIYRSEEPIDKEHQIDVQGAYDLIADTTFNISDDDATSTQEEEEDERIPLDSQLGQDAARLLEHYFPGSTITGITHTYSRGVFIGDYSIRMMCAVTHPIVQQVEMHFIHEDVPGRPNTWQELCALHINLYLSSLTLRNLSNGHPMTYSLPGMYQEDIERWCKTHDEGSLYGHIETPDMFIIATELLSNSHEEVEQTAKLLAVQARAKLEQENSL